MLSSYYTIARGGSAELVIRGSRFICSLKRTETEEEAKEFIDAVKKEHWKATHNCSAYLIGEQNEIQRAHDDGEPSGTAGIPMLEVLKKNELHDVAAVVTRYFGGTKLGAGGLIRAYSRSVADALQKVGIVERSLEIPVSSTVHYSASGKLENYLQQSPYTLLNTEYTDKVRFTAGVPAGETEQFKAVILDMMSGNVEFEEGKEQYVEHPIDKKQSDEWEDNDPE